MIGWWRGRCGGGRCVKVFGGFWNFFFFSVFSFFESGTVGDSNPINNYMCIIIIGLCL